MGIQNLFKKTLTVVTHNGSFHADEVFGVATLLIWADKNNINLKIVRTRDREIINKADIVLDVGDKYDPQNLRFDHHQKEGAIDHDEIKNVRVPYASFGLIWKHYGEKICNPDIAKYVENKLVLPIDAKDNGVNISEKIIPEIEDYSIRDMVVSFRPSWKDARKADERFMEAAQIARKVIENEIRFFTNESEGIKKIEQSLREQGENEIVELDEDLPWEKMIIKYPKVKMVVYPEPDTFSWCIEVVRDDIYDYNSNRTSFPLSWRGIRDKALQDVTGIHDAVFCHRGGFFAVVKSKEGAIALAKKALENQTNVL